MARWKFYSFHGPHFRVYHAPASAHFSAAGRGVLAARHWLVRPALFADARCGPVPHPIRCSRGVVTSVARLRAQGYTSAQARPCGRSRRPRDSRRPRGRRSSRPTSPALWATSPDAGTSPLYPAYVSARRAATAAGGASRGNAPAPPRRRACSRFTRERFGPCPTAGTCPRTPYTRARTRVHACGAYSFTFVLGG